MPAWQLAGIERRAPLLTTFTLGADDARGHGRQRAAAYAQARAIKLKLTGEIEIDVERVRAVRAARPDVWLGVDANQGFTPVDLERCSPALVEAARVAARAAAARAAARPTSTASSSPIPIAADESVLGARPTCRGLVGRFDVVNIKLDKCGGLTEGLHDGEARARSG